jgi:VRR-NUC domain
MDMTDTITVAEYKHKISEHQLQVELCKFLAVEAHSNCFWFAVGNGGRRPIGVARKMKAEGVKPGVADLAFMLPLGRMAWLELKIKGGSLSPEQKAFRDICERLGHPCAIAKSLDEAVLFLRHVGALR